VQGPFLWQRASFIALPLVELLGVKEWVLRVSQSVRVCEVCVCERERERDGVSVSVLQTSKIVAVTYECCSEWCSYVTLFAFSVARPNVMSVTVSKTDGSLQSGLKDQRQKISPSLLQS